MDGKIRASTGIPSRIVMAALMALFLLLSQRGVAANHKSHMINGTDAGKNGNLDELYHPNRVLVTFKATAYSAVGEETDLGIRPLVRGGKKDGGGALGRLMGKSDSGIGALAVNVYEISDGMSVDEKVAQLSSRRDVAMAEPDYLVTLYRQSSDTLLSSQWHQSMMRTRAAWDYGTGSSSVKVCVIDSGVNSVHPDLADNILKGWNVAPSENNQYYEPGSLEWNNYNDTLGHGTHVTGLIAAVGNNGEGVSGLAWRAGVLSCRFISDSGSGYVSDAITCIRLCQQEGAHIYSNSWGGVGFSATLQQEIQNLDAAGALFVVAAGNNNLLNLDSTPLYPASYKEANVLTVASTTSTDMLSGFSNIGPNSVHVAAPGSTIYSTTFDGRYGIMSGTSMSAPIVSGLAALLKSIALSSNYPLGASELKDIIIKSAVPFVNGQMYTISGGRADALAAVRLLKSKIKLNGMVKNNDGSSAKPRQSSTYRTHEAINGISTQSGYNARRVPGACSMTDPKRSHAWWTMGLEVDESGTNTVTGVSITARGDCCWNRLQGARVMIGDTPWTGSGSRKNFKSCGVVGKAVVRGGSGVNEVTCPAGGITGKYLAIYLPRKRTSLMLCGVQVHSQT
jgi:subtilisin family serine protease